MAYETLGWIATAVTVGLFCSNLQSISTVYNTRSTIGLSANSLYGTLFNCFWWTAYGLLTGIASVIACNSLGLMIGVWGLVAFTKFGPTPSDRTQTAMKSVVLGVGSASLAAFLAYSLPAAKAITVVGLIASTGSVLLFAAPLAGLRGIIQSRDASTMSPLVIVFSLATAGLWTAYAVLIGDAFMLLPNGLGLALSIVQVAVYCRYSRPKGMVIING
jgi:solute carrier family 50 protein (sugar transporter)